MDRASSTARNVTSESVTVDTIEESMRQALDQNSFPQSINDKSREPDSGGEGHRPGAGRVANIAQELRAIRDELAASRHHRGVSDAKLRAVMRSLVRQVSWVSWVTAIGALALVLIAYKLPG